MDALKVAIASKGPISVAIDASHKERTMNSFHLIVPSRSLVL